MNMQAINLGGQSGRHVIVCAATCLVLCTHKCQIVGLPCTTGGAITNTHNRPHQRATCSKQTGTKQVLIVGATDMNAMMSAASDDASSGLHLTAYHCQCLLVNHADSMQL